jgi:predicted nucleic acid-binding protein
VIVVLDASTLINLANGGVLDTILRLPGFEYHVSTVVRRESKTVADAIDAAVAEGRLGLVDDAIIPLADFVAAKQEFDLDDGETECLIAARVLEAIVACDDAAGRNAVRETLGVPRLKGSIGLLKMAVEEGLLGAEQASAAYALMRARGGYLLALAADYFG